jgi:hypothetical protein
MRALRRLAGLLVFGGAALAVLFVMWALARGRAQDMPWTPLDLAEPVGMFTGRKIAGLADDLPGCRAVLTRAGVRHQVLPPRRDGTQCGYADAVRFMSGGSRRIGFVPAGLGVACPVAAGLAAWEWHVVQPAARRHLGQPVVTIDHFGSYSCRRLYGRDAGAWSEHASADAVDIAGFRLADGRLITVVGDWRGEGRDAAFLREVRDGACDLFATVLSPDYNAAHRDHLHLDQAARGQMGWRACR